MYYDELTHRPRAQEFLVPYLRQGTLTLFLGAGVSTGMGLPGWVDLINRLRDEVSLGPVGETPRADELQVAADEVKQELASDSEWLLLIHKCLYIGMDELSSDVLQSELLVALGAMLMGSKRGSVRRVVSLNFDSILEWFLRLHGFVVRVVTQLPDLEGSEDARIYHPHGFLPHASLANSPASDFVLLGFDSVNERIGTLGDPWFEMMRHLFRTGMCLFVGVSERTFSDRILAPLLTTTAKEVRARPIGICLLRDGISRQQRDQFLRNKVVPLVIPESKGIANFLLGICQEAASMV